MRIGSIVQLVGPISGIDEYDKHFAAAEKRLARRGFRVWNPAAESAKHPGESYEWYMKMCMDHLLEADMIYLLQGFEKSRGAMREYCIATFVYELPAEAEISIPPMYLCDPLKCKGCPRHGCFFPVFSDKRQCAITADPEAAERDENGIPIRATRNRVLDRLFRFGA